MGFSFFSFLMAVIWSSIFFGILALLQRDIRFIRHFGITTVFIIYLGCILRFLLPLKLPFTKVIPDHVVYAALYGFFCLRKFHIGFLQMSIMEILAGISVLIALALAVRFFRRYFPFLRAASIPEEMSVLQRQQLSRVVEYLPVRKSCMLSIRVSYSSQATVPMGIGLRQRIVLLPRLNYTDEELYYILLHEFTHFANHDLYVKMGVSLLCIFFWWNPFVYLLRRNLDEILELKCDLYATAAMTNMEKADYLSVIISSLERAPDVITPVNHLPNARLIDVHKKELLKKRFSLTASSGKSNGTVCILLAAATFFLSYSFVLQPQYSAPAEDIATDWNSFEMTPENTFLSVDEAGQYHVTSTSDTHTKTARISKTYAEMLLESGFQMQEGDTP